MGDVERILTVSTGQEAAINDLLGKLQGKLGCSMPSAENPVLATGQKAAWDMVLAYAGGDASVTSHNPENQDLYELAIATLRASAVNQVPDGLANLNPYGNDRTTMDGQGTDLDLVALEAADWDQTYFDEWVEDPAWDYFDNTTVPQIREAFAGSNPRWSGRCERAVAEARRKLTLEILAKRGETAFSFQQLVGQMKDKQLDRKLQLTADRDKTNSTFRDKNVDRISAARESFLERLLKYQNEAINRRLTAVQGYTYFIEQPLNNYLKRAMAGMQSGELQRGVTGQSDMVDFQNEMRNHYLMNPAIEFLLAVCGQPMYTAVAESDDQSPWGAIAQGAFGLGSSLINSPNNPLGF